MSTNVGFQSGLQARLQQLRDEKVYKQLNYLDSPQAARVTMEGRGEILILSSNNYLGLCAESSVVQAGSAGFSPSVILAPRSLQARHRHGVSRSSARG